MVTEKYNHVLIEKENISQMQALSKLGDDSTGLRMRRLTLERCKCIPSLSLIMLSLPVLEERDARGRFICAQCVPSPLVL